MYCHQQISPFAYTHAYDEEEYKMERSFDNDELDATCAGVEESKGDNPMVDSISYEHDFVRPLDAIYLPDDGDETKSFIWVQCRTCN